MSLVTILKPIEAEFIAFKEYYATLFRSNIPLLNRALSHVCRSNGKMMRPMLVLLTAKSIAGRVGECTNYAAAALELLHTASLLHDDVVDESPMRRGIPSLHTLFSNRIAILAGDYIFSSALQNAALTRNVEVIEALSFLGQQLSKGELLQLQLQQSGGFSEENYIEVIRNKTASLFAACCRFGALSVEADAATVEAFTRFGELLGICFQMKDDIFDYYDSADVGKPTGSDMREGKITLPALYVLNNSDTEFARELLVKLADGYTMSDAEIDVLITMSKEKGGIDYALRRIEEFRAQALAAIPASVPDELREALTVYLDFAISRNK
jgi:octaprenyl-diphosphate synthase